MTFVVASPNTGDGTWGFRLVMKNDPLCPVSVETPGGNYTVLNSAYFEGTAYDLHTVTDFKNVTKDFRKAAEQYRVTALSATGYFVGATMTDQGSILAAQCSDATFRASIQRSKENVGANLVPLVGFGQQIPGTASITLGTNLYTAPAREGFYMPYKMESPELWHSTDRVATVRRYNAGLNLDAIEDLSTGWVAYPWGNTFGESTANNAFTSLWLPPLDDGIGVVIVDGIAMSTSFRITVRVAIEVMTRPTSSLASFCEPPALPDHHAINMYTEIASRLKDAYPSRDNSLGTLWQKIKSVASGIWKTVSPALAEVPGVGVVVKGINGLGGAIKALTKKAEEQPKKAKGSGPQPKSNGAQGGAQPAQGKKRRRRGKKKGGAGKPGQGPKAAKVDFVLKQLGPLLK